MSYDVMNRANTVTIHLADYVMTRANIETQICSNLKKTKQQNKSNRNNNDYTFIVIMILIMIITTVMICSSVA